MLLVDDDAGFRAALGAAFVRRGYEVALAGSPAEALSRAEEFLPGRVVVDLRMEGGSGLDLVRDLVRRFPGVAVLVLTGFGSIPTAIEAIRRGAINVLTKPAEPGEVEGAFREHEEGLSEHEEPAALAPEVTVPSLDRVEWEHIHRVLAECNGNISEAARRLSMHRRSLQRKLQKMPPRR